MEGARREGHCGRRGKVLPPESAAHSKSRALRSGRWPEATESTGFRAALTLCRPALSQILTFAYFSTEWDMDQPFSCLCGTERCIRTIQGAKDIEPSILNGSVSPSPPRAGVDIALTLRCSCLATLSTTTSSA